MKKFASFKKKNYTYLSLFLKCRFSFRNNMFSVLSDIYKEAFEHYKGTEEKKFNSKFGSLLHDLHQSLEQPVLSGGSSYGSTSCRCPPHLISISLSCEELYILLQKKKTFKVICNIQFILKFKKI